MNLYIADRNANHLNHTQGSSFTVEPLRTLIGEDSFTTFSQALLDGTANLEKLNVTPTIKFCLQLLKKKENILSNNKQGLILLDDIKQEDKE